MTPRQIPARSLSRTRRCIRHNSTLPSLDSSRQYCVNLLQKHDYPSYLQIPFLPASARDTHLAIRALNIELALIPDTVTNQNARTMRMQFWRDAVESCYQGQPKAEPVSIILARVLSKGTRLSKSFFQSIISERFNSLSPPPIPNIDALEIHISKAVTPLYYLLLESMGLLSLELDHICSHLSLCTGIVTTIRGLPVRIQHRELPLPIDICAKHNLVQENVFREGPRAEGLKDVIFEVATRGNDHLNTARQYLEDLRRKQRDLLDAAFCVFVPTIASREYLSWLEKVDFDPFVQRRRDWTLPFKMWRAYASRKL